MTGERGSAYIFLLITVAIIFGAVSNSLSSGSTTQRRQAEQELLFIGQAFENALNSYSSNTTRLKMGVSSVPFIPQGPNSMNELLLDPRFSQPLRHLRKPYADPITGKQEWGIIRNDSGQIIGIYSLSSAAPLKQSGFPPSLSHFEHAKSYQDWIFGAPGASIKIEKGTTGKRHQ